MSNPPSMVHKSGDHLVVRSVVSGNQLFGTSDHEDDDEDVDISANVEAVLDEGPAEVAPPVPFDPFPALTSVELPQCKVKRNYACSSCPYYTQNPRFYLHHLKNVHHERIRIYECPSCLYASKHSQKLQRHIHMVHVMGKRKLLIKAKSARPQRILPSNDRNDPCNQRRSFGNHDDDSSNGDGMTILCAQNSSSSTAENALQFTAGMELEEEESVRADANQSELIKCSQCSFSSHNENLVTRHERQVHLKKKFYRCSKCDYITHMKARFTKHVKYHSMPMIKCDMCDFRTPYKWNLDRHNKNHSANGAFKCSQCNFTADIKQSLTVHEMNHHVPPINQNGGSGQAMTLPAKRRCRVGASDIIDQQEAIAAEADLDDLELLRMERESLSSVLVDEYENVEDVDAMITSDEAAQMAAAEVTMVKPNASTGGKALNLKNPTAAAYFNGALKPEDVILTKNGSVYMKKYQCRVCKYKAAWESEMVRHELRVHGLDSAYAKKKPLPRPIPNLIPLQNNVNNGGGGSASSSTAASPSHSSASTPTGSISGSKAKTSALKNSLESPLKNGGGLLPGSLTFADLEYDKPLTEKDLNEIYSRSCANSSLKDFASVIGTDEETALKMDCNFVFGSEDMVQPKKEPEENEEKLQPKIEPEENVDTKPLENDTQAMDGKKLPDAFKKKSASFFEKNATFFNHLKEKLMVGVGEVPDLSCWCGHQSKCLSESVLHQKTHADGPSEKNDSSTKNRMLISGADLSSTRCQYCRQRCKTSSHLFEHLQSCAELSKKEALFKNYAATHGLQIGDTDSHSTTNDADEMPIDEDAPDNISNEFEDFSETGQNSAQPNKVFVWNEFLHDKGDSEEYAEDEYRSKSPASESSLVGFEIAPGIGSVMPSSNEEATDNFKHLNFDIHSVETTTKKVFKCPTCSFWASTASRFHVHVVSHLNVKPFCCSVCPYQSKWKWDVTKHIKLKRERDPAHESAEMRTVDVETGRRNYTKYNCFLTQMRVHEPRVELSSAALKSVVTSTPVPLLPKLTPAPSINGEADVGDSDVKMRPLPQLHPANPSVAKKRTLENGPTEEGGPRKKGRRMMWKCKKCTFRNTVRSKVVAHVKEHYTHDAPNAAADTASGADRADSMNGESRVSVNGIIRCELCYFETDNQTTFSIHNRHHVEDPSAAFRCCICPFFANDRQFMINHISTHGYANAEEMVLSATNNEDSFKKDDYEEKLEMSADEQATDEMSDGNLNKSDSGAGDEMEVYKRFKCLGCPYVTNNKSQYLYHKQFHKLRGAPFQCTMCTYNVTKRHLLHQHLKIHGVKRAQFKSCLKAAAEIKSVEEDGMKLNTNVDTAHLPDVPLVWVHKSGTLTKMFKCRHCPHVNLRKSNIHEHEKMHFDRLQRSPNGSVTTGQVSTHHCNDCNYVCNNAGALASHAKVHQGAFGQICALADSRRSDESQIREINRLFKEDERFKKEAPKPESLEKRLMPQAMEIALPARGEDGNAGAAPSDTSAPPPADRKNAAIELKTLFFCHVCPARFVHQKDLESHARFHCASHAFKCNSCSYSAPMDAQLKAHKRVHSGDYQEKTNNMVQKNAVSREFPRPRTTHIPDKPGFSGLGWVVVHTSQKKEDAVKPAKTVVKQFSCPKCPAQFFKSVALQHHLTLHGGKDQFQCRGCDYRVKTYGNLIKHEAVHGLEPRLKAKVLKSKQKMSFVPVDVSPADACVPSSGTELFQQRSELLKREPHSPTATPSHASPAYVIPTPPSAAAIAAAGLSGDPEFGIFIFGSPDFIYPKTQKNGKMKEKRYKCHKCPSAFEKREQYKTHLTLHGAKSKFRCERCDYAVRYFANYAQHVRKHELSDERLANLQAKTGFHDSGSSEVGAAEHSHPIFGAGITCADDSSIDFPQNHFLTGSPEKIVVTQSYPTPTKATKTLHISVADQQAVVLMQEKVSDCGINMADQLHRCVYCPYSHQRKDAVENHERCHINPKGSCVCEFCNYTVPQPHFLREHQKLHFGAMKGVKPEAYMKCDRLEIWMETEQGKVLIFKDSGRKENRFEPEVTVNEEDSEFKKMYVDVRTGEERTPCKNESQFEENGDDQGPISPKPDYNFVTMHASPLPILPPGTSAPDPNSLAARLKELAAMQEKMATVKEEPIDDDEPKVDDMDDEDFAKMVENPDEELENSGDDEEEDEDDVELVENEKDEEDESYVEESSNAEPMATEEMDYDRSSEYVGETDDEAELEEAERNGDHTENDDSEMMDESAELQVDAPDLEEDEEKEVSAFDSTIDLTDSAKAEKSEDSDSEDSESSSSSSSGSGTGSGSGSRSGSGSVSGSSCSSSDTSDDEETKNNSAETNNTTSDSAEADVIAPE